MNGQRITIGLIVLFLCGLCLIQTTMTGCSSSDGLGDESEGGLMEDGLPFYARSGGDDTGIPADWTSVSDNVLGQIDDMYNAHGFEFQELELSESGPSATRCLLAPREGLTGTKQLLDGLLILHHTFPNQYLYIVEIQNDTHIRVESNWDTLDALVDGGYSFETSSEEAAIFWKEFLNLTEVEELHEETVVPNDGNMVPIQIGS